MRISKLIVGLFFLIGLAFLGGMVWHVGLTDLLMSFQAVGFWIVPLFLLESIPILLHTAGWAACFDESRHPVLSNRFLATLRPWRPRRVEGGWRTVKRSPYERPAAALFRGKTAHNIGKFFVHHSGHAHQERIEPLPLVTRVRNEDVLPQLAHRDQGSSRIAHIVQRLCAHHEVKDPLSAADLQDGCMWYALHNAPQMGKACLLIRISQKVPRIRTFAEEPL